MGVPDIDTALGWRGRKVRDTHGEELGTIRDLYLDAGDDRPAWAGVKRGLLRPTSTVIPLEDLTEGEDGDLHAPFESARFESAPDVDPDVALTEDEQRALHEHYGRPWDAPSGEETDSAMTRSEEEVEFGKRTTSGPSACGSARCWSRTRSPRPCPCARRSSSSRRSRRPRAGSSPSRRSTATSGDAGGS